MFDRANGRTFGSGGLTGGRRAKVAIIDDHPIVRAGFASLLSRDSTFEICGEADDVASGFALIERTRPDAVIVDLALRNGTGIDLIRRVKAGKIPVRILVVSMYDEHVFGERAARAGAAGYVNKQEAGRSMIKALRKLLDGKRYFSESVASRIHSQARSGSSPDEECPISQLSERELQVFSMLGHGILPAEIAARLRVSVKTVDTYRQRIKDKLFLRSSAELNREAMHWSLEGSLTPRSAQP
jgi:DNA-binding NarL/FixJ family response regulator